MVGFFRDTLGYDYLGHWQDRLDNGNIEEKLLEDWLRRQGHGEGIIAKALYELRRAAALGGSKTLYDANREVYDRLRYGVKVRPEMGESTRTVWLIDWQNPGNNDFAIAEEVSVAGRNAKRPDLVLYVNGVAFGVLELKRSTVSVGEGNSPEPRQPEARVHSTVLRHRAARAGGQRIGGPALQRDRDPGEALAALEGSRARLRHRRQPASPGAWTTMRQGAAARGRA